MPPDILKDKLTDEEFSTIQKMVYNSIGVNLTEAKRSLTISRLSKRLRELELDSFTQYIRFLERTPGELDVLFNLITTNVTNFFREKHHFAYLEQEYFPWCEAEKKARGGAKTIRAWSSACSTGEEPYTLAMVMQEYFSAAKGWTPRIMASDINTEALNKARAGVYKKQEVTGVPYDLLKKYFRLGSGANQGLFKVKDVLQKMISFQRVNLTSSKEYPFSEPLDIIFCRNVFIYFDRDTQNKILHRFHQCLKPQGLLFLGHSESINLRGEHLGKWQLLSHTIYQRLP